MVTFNKLKLLYYFKNKDEYIFNIVKNFAMFKSDDTLGRYIEVSSEASKKQDKKTFRVALTCMKKNQLLKLIKVGKLGKREEIKNYLFNNSKDDCFGLGLAKYENNIEDNRFKIYSYYYRSTKEIDIEDNLKRNSQLANINFLSIEKDIKEFKKIKMSSVDFYSNGEKAIKVYYGPFLTNNFFSQFNHLFNKSTLAAYRQLFLQRKLPDIFLLCIRYMQNKKSIRTDFWCATRNIKKYIHNFDYSSFAYQLYEELKRFRNLELTFICIDLDKRNRTQYYFALS